jgi:hypothetical protein
MAQMKPSISRPIAVTIWFLFWPRAAIMSAGTVKHHLVLRMVPLSVLK